MWPFGSWFSSLGTLTLQAAVRGSAFHADSPVCSFVCGAGGDWLFAQQPAGERAKGRRSPGTAYLAGRGASGATSTVALGEEGGAQTGAMRRGVHHAGTRHSPPPQIYAPLPSLSFPGSLESPPTAGRTCGLGSVTLPPGGTRSP